MHSEEMRAELLERLLRVPHALDSVLKELVPRDGTGNVALAAGLLDVLFGLDLSEAESAKLVVAICSHRERMEEATGRPVDYRVAGLDYLIQEGIGLRNPKITELRDYENRFRLATTDELTGLHNRRFIAEALDRELHRSRRYGLPFSILFLDIDNFKLVNDNFGHQTGDEVLRSFSQYLRLFVRSEDVVGRYGGEEFLVVMPQTDTDGARRLGGRLLGGLDTHPVHRDHPVTFSGGISTFPIHAQTAEGLVQMADIGLYRSKLHGKRQIQVAPDEKRREKRYQMGRSLEIEHGGNALRGRVNNVSRTGISFDATYPLDIGDTVSIRIRFAETARDYEITGKVVWTRVVTDGVQGAAPEITNGLRYRFGARYSEPSDIDRLISAGPTTF